MIRKVYLDLLRARLARGEAGWLARQAGRYLLAGAGVQIGRPLCGPILGTLATNYGCPFSCRMCELPARAAGLRGRGLTELDTAGMLEVLRGFARLGTPGIGFTGGEPLLRGDLPELLRACRRLGMITHLNTNGWLLDRPWAREIVAAGVDSLNVSLDGASPEVHDRVRGQNGAFERAVEAVRLVQEERTRAGSRLRLKIVGVVDGETAAGIPALLALGARLGVECVELIPRQPFTTSGTDPAGLPLDAGAARAVVDQLEQRRRAGIPLENSARMVRLMEWTLRGLASPLACRAAYCSLGVDSFGEIYPCVPWMNWGKSIGSVAALSLPEFWYSRGGGGWRREVAACRACTLNCQAELSLLFTPRTFRAGPGG